MAIIICSMAISIAHDDHLSFAIYGHYYSLSIASMAIIMVILAIIIAIIMARMAISIAINGH